MNYELAKQLKDAGFPQVQTHPSGQDYRDCTNPTLSELIEACGNVTIMIWGCKLHGYYAAIQPCNQSLHEWASIIEGKGSGPDPDVAVARLWLALNKK